MTDQNDSTRVGYTRRLLIRLCPHWYWPVPQDYITDIMFEVTKREKCRICGQRRVFARVPEPHPTRSKDQLLDELQRPGYEFIVEEWLPYEYRQSEDWPGGSYD